MTNSSPRKNDQSDVALLKRLEATGPVIEKIREISGNAGISLGILHRGRVLYRANYGYRDVEARLKPTSDTVFPIASMSKALIASAFARLVDEGDFDWDTKLSSLVPEYSAPSDVIKCPELVTEANVVDLLAHRLGLARGDSYWLQKSQQVLVDRSETANMLGSLQPLSPFREKFMYSNWGYGLAGEILENITGMNMEEYFQKNVFKPLGMLHSTMAVPDEDKYAKAYMALSNATPWEIPPTGYEAGKSRAGAGACKSSINDLLVLYEAWMDSAADQEHRKSTSTAQSPFYRIADTWTSKMEINDGTGYGLGWCLTELPKVVGLLSVNEYECPNLPVLARGTQPQRLIYHQGSVCGALSAVYLLPETRSAVVVLGNSFDLCDTPDWISQLLIETLLDVSDPNDFVALAQQTSANAVSHHRLTNQNLDRERIPGTRPRPLEEYCGRFYNSLGNFFLEITVHGAGLRMSSQGFENTSYLLEHYHHDVFAWPCDRDAECKEAVFPRWTIGFHKVAFQSGIDGKITMCNWQLDKGVTDGDTFVRR